MVAGNELACTLCESERIPLPLQHPAPSTCTHRALHDIAGDVVVHGSIDGETLRSVCGAAAKSKPTRLIDDEECRGLQMCMCTHAPARPSI